MRPIRTDPPEHEEERSGPEPIRSSSSATTEEAEDVEQDVNVSRGLRLAQSSPTLQYEAALTYAFWFDDGTTALNLLRKALEGGHPWRALERSPSLDRLRGDSRFDELRRHIPRQAAVTTQGG